MHFDLTHILQSLQNFHVTPWKVIGYLGTLMRFRRSGPPALLPSTLGEFGALTGASELIFDAFLTPRGLGAWPGPEEKTA